jgi:zinc protease
MLNTVLTPEIIDAERLVVYEEFATRIGNDPGSWLNVEVRGALFSHHPYGVPIIGYMDELAAVDHDDIIAFHKTWYAPGNAVVVVTGPVTLDQLKVLAEDTYGLLPAAETPERVRPVEPDHYAPRSVTLQHPQIGQASWSRTYLAPSYTTGASEHAYALQVLAEILGSGTDSRLYQHVVLDQGTAIGAGAGYNADAMDLGTFVLWGTPPVSEDDAAAVAAVGAAIDAEVAKLLEEGVTQAEVDGAITQLQASAIFARDSLMAGANIVGQALVTGRGIEDVESWPDEIAAVTAEQVNAAAKAVFEVNNSVTGIALPTPAM